MRNIDKKNRLKNILKEILLIMPFLSFSLLQGAEIKKSYCRLDFKAK